jgi:hypothetical protein
MLMAMGVVMIHVFSVMLILTLRLMFPFFSLLFSETVCNSSATKVNNAWSSDRSALRGITSSDAPS